MQQYVKPLSARTHVKATALHPSIFFEVSLDMVKWANAKLSYPERAHKLWSDVDGEAGRS